MSPALFKINLITLSIVDKKTGFQYQYQSVPPMWKIIVHYNGAIMGAIASQITSLTIVYSTVYSDADQRKHQSSASLAIVPGDRWIPRTNGQ